MAIGKVFQVRVSILLTRPAGLNVRPAIFLEGRNIFRCHLLFPKKMFRPKEMEGYEFNDVISGRNT